MPEHPFLLFGQMTTADPTRSPAGHRVGLGLHARAARADAATRASTSRSRRVEAVIEEHAPGFRDLVLARRVQGPGDLEDTDSQPGRRRGQRRDGQHPPAADLPAGPRARAVPRRRWTGSTWPRRRPTPAVGCTAAPGANAATAALSRARVTGRAKRRMLEYAFGKVYG